MSIGSIHKLTSSSCRKSLPQSYRYLIMAGIVIQWAQRAWNYFWGPNYNGTAQEQIRQEGIVNNFAAVNVPNAASAEITYVC